MSREEADQPVKIEPDQIWENWKGWRRQVLEIADKPFDGPWSYKDVKTKGWVKIQQISGKGKQRPWWVTANWLRRWGRPID